MMSHSHLNHLYVKMVLKMSENITSVINKYPSHRDDKINGCWKWMQGRRKDDNAGGLWRVHDKLYDLTSFIDKHPGGRQWLIISKGTDVTEAFETHHITPKAGEVLKKFLVGDAAEPRNYKLTFEENGFYKALKRRAADKIKTLDPQKESKRSKLIHDLNLIALFVSLYFATRVNNALALAFWTLLSGQCVGWSANFAHNFIHQKDNWRMYSANLSLMSWRDFRVFHVMSHHLYTNTFADLEISNFEPNLKWLPYSAKNKITIIYSRLASPIIWSTIFPTAYVLRIFGGIFSETQVWFWDELLSLSLPAFMIVFGNTAMNISGIAIVLLHWLIILMIGSFAYGLFAFNNGHHGPSIVHEGDEIENLDFGAFQIRAFVEREAMDSNDFLVLAYFGQHTLHHLFPTLDHSILPHLETLFFETCEEFSILPNKKTTILNAMSDQFKQLGRTVTKKLC